MYETPVGWIGGETVHNGMIRSVDRLVMEAKAVSEESVNQPMKGPTAVFSLGKDVHSPDVRGWKYDEDSG